MPSRLFIVAIVACWLGMGALLVRNDLYPRLRSDEPLAFSLDLTDEARIDLDERRSRTDLGSGYSDLDNRIPPSLRTRSWQAYKDDRNVGYAETRVVYQRRDHTLELAGEYKRLSDESQRAPLVRLDSALRINWDGELLTLRADLWDAAVKDKQTGQDRKTAQFDAVVHEGVFTPEWRVLVDNARKKAGGEPVALSARGGLLVAQQPLPRMTGLHVGQRWRAPVLDLLPLKEGRGPDVAQADVEVAADEVPWIRRFRMGAPTRKGPMGLPPPGSLADPGIGPEALPPRDTRTVPCFVVTYHGGGRVLARVWVQMSDGLVLEQEFTHGGETLLLIWTIG